MSPDAIDRLARTPLMYAIADGDQKLVETLIRAGADVCAADVNGWTPLHFAAQGYNSKMARLLLDNRAEVDARDANGNTPLWRAVFESRGRGDLIKLLLARGGDRTLKNKHGVSPENLANTIANFDIAKFFT